MFVVYHCAVNGEVIKQNNLYINHKRNNCTKTKELNSYKQIYSTIIKQKSEQCNVHKTGIKHNFKCIDDSSNNTRKILIVFVIIDKLVF